MTLLPDRPIAETCRKMVVWGGMLATLALGLPAQAGNRFEQDVLPLFRKHCADCHSQDLAELGLDLTSESSALRGSETGYIVVPGQASQSLLLQLVASGSKPHMPPEGQLSDVEIETLTTWVNSLKPTELPVRAELLRGQSHWAFQPLKRPNLPTLAPAVAARARQPLDAFVLDGLSKVGLSLSPEASRAQLIRRVTFDVTGLPPSPEEVQQFVADETPDAYERLVDRLLADPAYGEHWGRHWLDLARYADSGGFHDDLDRPFAWRYRDFVINSLNADKPYQQFVAEQLAGDELAPDRLEALAATAFCRNGPTNDDNMGNNALERERYRLDLLDDTVATTSAVFMGLTVGCARCHDHKFDPISQADYYRILAFFNSTTRRNVAVDEFGQPLLAKNAEKGQASVMVTTAVGGSARKTYLLWRGDAANQGPEIAADVPSVLANWSLDSADLGSQNALSAAGDAPKPGRNNRLALAQWLVRDDHPLTWRVIANRLWQQHFGTGIVATTSNFGVTGAAPTHPELLDWLASELVAQGGQWKSLHRQILTSATYRQSSQWRPEAAAIDPENRWLWRREKQRLSAEAIRDSVLFVAGTLNDARGGPGIKPRIPAELLVSSQRNKWPVVAAENPTHWRRSVYVYVKRQLLMPMLELFDAPSTNQTCEQRANSIVPTQALVLMNDQFSQDQAGFLAKRVEAAAGTEFSEQMRQAHWFTLGQQPSSQRLQDGVTFLQQQAEYHRSRSTSDSIATLAALTDLCHVLLNSNEFMYID